MTWRIFDSILNNASISSLALDPRNANVLYAGTAPQSEAFALKLNPAGTSLVYAAYLGGINGSGIAVDALGSAYITGSGIPRELRNGFPVVSGTGFASTPGFMLKLNPQGTETVYSTKLPGAGKGIAIDGTGKAYVTGTIFSDNSMTMKNGFQTNIGVLPDAFVVKIDPQKSGEDSLLYSTYLGGNGGAEAAAIAVDSGGRTYVTGFSNGIPISTPVSSTGNIFIIKIDAAKSGRESLVWSTRLGEGTATGLAVDSAGNVYVTGASKGGTFPITPGALHNYSGGSCERRLICNPPPQMPCSCMFPPKPLCPTPTIEEIPNTCFDAFVSKVNATGSLLLYSTYLGNAGTNEGGNAISLDAAGNVYVTGFGSLPPTPGAFQNAGALGFIAKLTLDSRNTSVASVSAASFLGPQLAPESLAVGFLDAFGVGADNLKVIVRDSVGTERDAAVLFSGFGQVNFQIPPGMADGDATVKVTSGGAAIATGAVQIVKVAPGVFTANANGHGVAAAVVQRVRADGSQSYEMLARYDQSLKQWVSIPIDLGPESDQVFLALFGTGWRFRSSESAVRVTIGGVEVPLLYAGLQPTLTGVDQINVRLPRTLAGKGEVDLVVTVDGKPANIVRANIK